MPIGLSDDGPRECDTLARERLRPDRSASVFSAPPRAAVEEAKASYVVACRLAQAATGKKISKQAWNLTPKIREVRALLLKKPRLRSRLFETHPELCFASLAGGRALVESKKSAAGVRRRTELLAGLFGAAAVARLTSQTELTRGVGIDDTLDAMACWTAAARAAEASDDILPATSVKDATGLPIAIRF